VAPDAWDWGDEPTEDDHSWGTVDWDDPGPTPDVADRSAPAPCGDRFSELPQPRQRRRTRRAQSLFGDVGSGGSGGTSAGARYLTWGTAGVGIIANLCTMAAFRSVNVTSLQPFSGSIAWAWMAMGAFAILAATATAALVLAAVRRHGRLALNTVALVAVVLSVASLVVQSEVVRLQRRIEEIYLRDPTALIERARIWADELGLTRAAIENLIRGIID
jgi:hypothetical protein